MPAEKGKPSKFDRKPPQSIAILRKEGWCQMQKGIKSLKQLLGIVDELIINKATIIEVLDSDLGDFEDALQSLFAQNEKEIKIIITRNVKDYTASNLPVVLPETI